MSTKSLFSFYTGETQVKYRLNNLFPTKGSKKKKNSKLFSSSFKTTLPIGVTFSELPLQS